MKKRVVFLLAVITSVLSLQSCVTNYVVSEPALYHNQYKDNAKVSSIATKRQEQNKKDLISSFASQKVAEIANANNIIKNSEIAKVINLEKTIDGLLEEAKTYLGTPYRFGGMTRNGIDCSAFVLSVFGAAAGISLPRVASAQSHEGGEKIEKESLQKGDLIFFTRGRNIGHVGIVEEVSPEGEIKFIHAATSKGVMISSLDDPYWKQKFRFGKRIITEETTQNKSNLASILFDQ